MNWPVLLLAACQLQDGLLKGVATATGGGYQHGGMNLMPNSARMNRGAQSQHQFDQNLLSNRLQTRPLMLQQPTLQPEGPSCSLITLVDVVLVVCSSPEN